MKNLEYIKKLVSIKSYQTNENKEIINYLYDEFSKTAVEVVKIKNKTDKRENLLIGLNTKLENIQNAVVLAGHIDTVVADEKLYKSNPYNLVVDENNITGLGVADMKSFFACVLNNTLKLKKLSKPVVIAITGDEETNLNGVAEVVLEMRTRNIKPRITIVGEPTNKKVCTSSKSCYEYSVEIYGKSCHSSNPQSGVNANYIAARLIMFIERLCYRIKNTITTANVVTGGEKINIVSSFAKVNFDIRSTTRINKNKVLKKVEKYIKILLKKYKGCKIVLSETLAIPSLEKTKSQTVKNFIKKFNLTEEVFVGGCEAGYFQALSGDAIVFGVGDMNQAHKPNESVSLIDFNYYDKNFVKFIKYI